MRKQVGSRSIPMALGIGLLIVLLGGCGWFSRSTGKSAGAPTPAQTAPAAPAVSPAPAPPPPATGPRGAGGRIADEEMLRGLAQGKTTRAEVRELFGIPREVVMGPGVETFIYYRDRSSGWISRTTERVEMLTVRFDANGLLKDFEYRYSGR